MIMLTLLLKNQWQPTLTLLIPPSNKWPWEKSFLRHLLACKRIRRTSNFATSTKHSPVTYLKVLVPNQLPWRLASTHAPPPQTRECQYHSKLPYRRCYQSRTVNATKPLSTMALPMDGAASNAYLLTASYVPAKTKCIIMKYRNPEQPKACGMV